MKSYPRSQFELVNNTSINTVSATSASKTVPIMMTTMTSDKGDEGWKLIRSKEELVKSHGKISFAKHGQAQLTVAKMLESGACVLCKRLVSDDAILANTTVKATVITVSGVSYVYLTAVSATTAQTFEEACASGRGAFDPSVAANGAITIPLFTVAAKGRGVSEAYFRIAPDYYTSKSANYSKYTFEVLEGSSVLETIGFAMNSDAIENGVNQSLQSKVATKSGQVDLRIYEDGINKLVEELAKTAKIDAVAIPASDLINMDFINGFDKKGAKPISGIVTKATTVAPGHDTDSIWTVNIPSGFTPFDLNEAAGIKLAGGSYGAMGNSPMSNKTELNKLLLGAWGANKDSAQYSSAIYDLDNYKIDAIIDCDYPVNVKNAMIDIAEFRGDCCAIIDLGSTGNKTLDDIVSAADAITVNNFAAIYCNHFCVLDPNTNKQIRVTMPYLIASRLIDHIISGVGKPFAGIANNVTFPEIIEGTINFRPVVIPGLDQKAKLVDSNVNYISYYDGLAVMETMYTNADEYTKLSFLHNVMLTQEVIKVIRIKCPKTRYTFLDGDDLQKYIDDVNAVINEYKTYFKTIQMQYQYDPNYESNNIFYAVLTVSYKNFANEEYFKIYAIN